MAGDGIKKEKRTKKPKGDEVIREMADDSGAGRMTRKRKMAAWTLSQILLKYRPTEELMGYPATEKLKEEITPEFQEKREFDRTNGYAEIKEG